MSVRAVAKRMMTMTMTPNFSELQVERLRAHANQSIYHILDKLNIGYTSGNDLIRSKCPCKQHNGDGTNPAAFSWKKSIGSWRCWTHHCEDDFGADIFGLVRSVVGLKWTDSIEWLYDTLINHKIDLSQDVSINHTLRSSQMKIHAPLNETCLKFLSIYDDPLLKRGFKASTLRNFEIGFWNRLGTFMHNRLVFPIRDTQGFLVGFSGRTIYNEVDWPKYNVKAKWVHGRYFDRWPVTNELQTGSLLYNLHRALKSLQVDKSIILVEGPLDGLRLHEAGIHNWIAILGCSFGNIHRSMLINNGINKLILALDRDDAGQEASDKIEESVKDFFHIERPSLQNDPGKSTIEELKKVFNVN